MTVEFEFKSTKVRGNFQEGRVDDSCGGYRWVPARLDDIEVRIEGQWVDAHDVWPIEKFFEVRNHVSTVSNMWGM